ncbi:filaggrin-2 [Sapajus apella]|uniref:Filaggrin-2 n=1 Tax=Sapajus apella TaxID=9515 RepID=A0A6J3HBQ5_SAPAP|nr:filaggrin-2 [Sapajus apella]
MTDLLRSVVTVIDVFYKYTKQDEECGTLSKYELKELLEKEFRPILKNPDDPDTVDVIMHMLDRDHDRRLDFTEFLLMVFKLALACNKVLSKEYCKASGSKKHRHGHQHQEEESETEEDEEDTPGRKSGYRHSSWSKGEEHGYSSGGSRGTVKCRHGSNSRRLGRQGNLSSSGNQERSEKRHHRSSSGHSWSSGKERHGSSSGELGERINKSHVSPSRESGEEYESECGSKSWGRKGHGGLSRGLETSQHESNCTQSRSRGQKLEYNCSVSGGSERQSHACGYSNSGGCGRPQTASSSRQSHRFGGQGYQSSYTQSGCQSEINGGQGHGCVSGGQPSGCVQPESNSCGQSYSQRAYGAREHGQPQNCGGQQRTGTSQSSCGQYRSGGSQSCSNGQHDYGSCGHFSNSSSSNEFSKCGQHESGSDQSTSCEQHGTGLSQSSGFEQHVSGSGQTCGQHGSRSNQSSGYDQHGYSSGQTSGFGQHGSGSGLSSGFGQCGSGSDQSSGYGQHGSGSHQSSGFGQYGSGSGQSSGFGQHESRSSQSRYGQHGTGSSQSSGYGQHGSSSDATTGIGQHESGSGHFSSSGQHISASGQSTRCGQYGSGSGQSTGLGQTVSRQGESISTVHKRQETTHGQRVDTTRHGQSGHRQSTQIGSRTTRRRRSSQSENNDSEVHSGVSHTHSGQQIPDLPEQVIFSHIVVKDKGMDQVQLGNMAAMDLQNITMGTLGSKATKRTGKQGLIHEQSMISHEKSIDSQYQSGPIIIRSQESSHGCSVVTHKQSNHTYVCPGYNTGRRNGCTYSQSSDHPVFGHGQCILIHSHSESSSNRKQESHNDSKRHSEDWEKDTHEQLGSRHEKLDFSTIAIHGSSQQMGDTTFHGQVHIYCQNMSTLLENIFGIIDLFMKYSKKDKNTETLSKKELKELLDNEFRPILKNPDDPDTVEVFMDNLDIDHNKKIDFTEFLLMIFKLAKAYYELNRKQNLSTSGHRRKRHSHHEKHEDDKEEEEKQKKIRPSRRMIEKWRETGDTATYYTIQNKVYDANDNQREKHNKLKPASTSYDQSSSQEERRRGSSVSQESHSKGHSESDSERRSGSGSRDHHGSTREQSRNGSRHPEFQQADRACYGHPSSVLSDSSTSKEHAHSSILSQDSEYCSGIQSSGNDDTSCSHEFHSDSTERHGGQSDLVWRHGSYGSADYDYGEAGFSHSQGGSVSYNSNPEVFKERYNIKKARSFVEDHPRFYATYINRYPGLYGRSSDLSKKLGFSQSQRYYFYE